MIYQIFYDDVTAEAVQNPPEFVTPLGVHNALKLQRVAGYIYDDQNQPNLTTHNTLCEWRALYYIWKHHPGPWVGFTSWKHDNKGFAPILSRMHEQWILRRLQQTPIVGFSVRPLQQLMIEGLQPPLPVTLKSQFVQWSLIEAVLQKDVNDTRSLPLGRYHSGVYWDFVMKAYRRHYAVDLEKELDWQALGRIDALHTWCNAFVAEWWYFDAYMQRFSPIVFELLEHFGSHPIDLELSYICERLIILFNYIRFANGTLSAAPKQTARSTARAFAPARSEPAAAGDRLPHRPLAARRRSVSGDFNAFSIITCSANDDRFRGFEENVSSVFSRNAQLIRVADARSLAEGYNRAIGHADGRVLIFCHDDIRFLSSDSPAIIRQDLENVDMIGVAGTTRIVGGQWHASGHPHTHGQVVHPVVLPNGMLYQLCQYGSDGETAVIRNIQALDGLFIAVNRDVTDLMRFDEQLFDGFHLYDLDFTYAAYLKGLKIAVDYRIPLLHQSGGRYDHQWHRYAKRFLDKYAGMLEPMEPNASCAFTYFTSTSLDELRRNMSGNFRCDHPIDA